LSTTCKILSRRLLSRSNQYSEQKLLVIISVDFDATGQLLIVYTAYVKYLRKNFTVEVHQLFIDFKKDCDSVRKVVLHNILIEFSIPMNLLRLIKMCLKETYSRVQFGIYLSDIIPIKNGLK
jgi:hypothetical protein